MKIIQLVMARQLRGVEIFTARLSKEIINQGIDVYYVSLYKNDGKELMMEGIPYHDLQAVKRSTLNLSLILKLKSLMHEYQPDIVQANAGDTLKYAVLVKVLFGYNYKIVFRNASVVSQYLKSPVQKWIYRYLYSRVDYIVSVSERSMNDLIALFPFCKSKIKVIPVGINLATFSQLPIFQPGFTHLVHVGGFTFEKNHEGLISIIKQLRTEVANLKLWLIGDGPLKNKIEAEVATNELSDVVIFTGAVSNVLDYISSARMLLLPSVIEGLPAVILEAFYCRTPVVAYDVGGISEVVKNRSTGWLVKAGDEVGFVNAIHEVLNHSDQTIIENAYRMVVSEFDNRVIAKRFLEVYGKV